MLSLYMYTFLASAEEVLIYLKMEEVFSSEILIIQ
jgi:hypothetical protein